MFRDPVGQGPWTFIQKVSSVYSAPFFNITEGNPHFWLVHYSLKLLGIKNVHSCPCRYFWPWGLLLKHGRLTPGQANGGSEKWGGWAGVVQFISVWTFWLARSTLMAFIFARSLPVSWVQCQALRSPSANADGPSALASVQLHFSHFVFKPSSRPRGLF